MVGNLVFTIKIGEKFYIGENILVELISRDSNKVRVRVVAPKEIKVLREKLLNEPREWFIRIKRILY